MKKGQWLAQRTLVLGLVTLAALIVSAIWSFGVEAGEIARHALMLVLLLVLLMMAGLAGALMLVGLRRLRERRRPPS